MTVKLADNGTILMIGDCPAEDADLLLQHLLEHPTATVDWGGCSSAHTAVVQVLLAAGQLPAGMPVGTFLQKTIGPALDRARQQVHPFRDA